MNNYQIEILKTAKKKDLKKLNNLLHQLDSSCLKINLNSLKEILSQNNLFFLVAKDFQQEIIGLIILVCFKTLSGFHARLEDFVVDEKQRGKGLGKKLLHRAIKLAKKLKVSHIDLTSRPERKVANYLYQKFGFHQRKTNVYRYQFKK